VDELDVRQKLKTMARIPEKSPRFRTKERLSQDIAAVLSSPDLSYGTKHVVLADAVWVWSEFYGKYAGCPFWSVAAREANSIKELCHEHVVPKRYIIQRLLDLSPPTPEDVHGVLSTYCIGAVVTRDEDRQITQAGFRSSMPDEWDTKDIWIRYRLAGIQMEEKAEQDVHGNTH
jgi:hypothetical protein